MNKKVITNAVNAEMPAGMKAEAGKPLVINLAPFGEYPQTIDDPDKDGETIEVNQILDEKAVDTLIANFKDRVLVDADHSSELSTDTKAMAWVTRLFKDPKNGLMAEIEPTSIGADNINGKVYRFVSGAWTLDDEGRPIELLSIGLTNRPNLPVAPMINAKTANAQVIDDPGGQPVENNGDAMTDKKSEVAANAGETDDSKKAELQPATVAENDDTIQPQGDNSMNLKEKLGLSEEATDADIEEAIDALLKKCEGMEAVQNALGLDPTCTNEEVLEAMNAVLNQCNEYQVKNEEMERERLTNEADQLIAENEDVIPEESVDEIKETYIENPDEARATVENMRRVYNRAIRNSSKRETRVPTRVRISNSSAKKSVALNMSETLSSCGGDPAKELEMLRAMYPKH